MAELRKFISTSPLILVAIGISAAAVGVLFTFPQNPLIWQAATWTLVAALVGLLALVLVTGYALVTDRAARTWQRITSFLVGFACLAAVAVASLQIAHLAPASLLLLSPPLLVRFGLSAVATAGRLAHVSGRSPIHQACKPCRAKALLFAAVASVVRGKPKFWSRATDAGNTLDKPIDLGLAVRIWTSRILPGVILPPGATQFPGEPDESRSAA